MGIDFRAKVQGYIDYFGDVQSDGTKVLEHSSLVIDAEFDLGNYRALRRVMPDDGECCGVVTLDGLQALEWLEIAHDGCGAIQIDAAAKYIDTILRAVGDELRMEVEVSYA